MARLSVPRVRRRRVHELPVGRAVARVGAGRAVCSLARAAPRGVARARAPVQADVPLGRGEAALGRSDLARAPSALVSLLDPAPPDARESARGGAAPSAPPPAAPPHPPPAARPPPRNAPS